MVRRRALAPSRIMRPGCCPCFEMRPTGRREARPMTPTLLLTMRVWPAYSVAVRAHLVRYPTLFQTALRQPGVGAADSAFDMIGRAREVVRRSYQRTQRRHHEVFDAGTETLQFAHQLPRDQERQRMQRICHRAG